MSPKDTNTNVMTRRTKTSGSQSLGSYSEASSMTQSGVKECPIPMGDGPGCAQSVCARSTHEGSTQDHKRSVQARSIQTSESLLCLCDGLNLKEPLRGTVKKLSAILRHLENHQGDDARVQECIEEFTKMLAKFSEMLVKKLGIDFNFDSLPYNDDSGASEGACGSAYHTSSKQTWSETPELKYQVVPKDSDNSDKDDDDNDGEDSTSDVLKGNKTCSKEERTHTKAKELTEDFSLEGVDVEKIPGKQQNTQITATAKPNACTESTELEQEANVPEDSTPSELRQQLNTEADSHEQKTQQQPEPALAPFRNASASPDCQQDIYSAPPSSSSSSSSSTCHKSQGARPKVPLQSRQLSVPDENTQQQQQQQQSTPAPRTGEAQRGHTKVDEEVLYGLRTSDLTKPGIVPKANEVKTGHLDLQQPSQQVELSTEAKSKPQLQSETPKHLQYLKYGTSAASRPLHNILYDEERSHSVPEASTCTKTFHEDSTSKSLDDFAANSHRTPIKFQYQSFSSGGERPYYFGLPGLGPRKHRSTGMQSLPFETNWPLKPPAPRKQSQWHSLYASNQDSPLEAAAGAASSVFDSLKSRSASTSQNKMAAVAENDAFSSVMTSSTRTSGTLQTDGHCAASLVTPDVSSREGRIPDLPFRTDNMSKSTPGRLVTDHASSRDTSTDHALTSATPKSRSNLPQGHDAIPSVAIPEPNHLESEANASSVNDLETDCSYVHVTQDDVIEAIAAGNTENEPSRDQSAATVSEPMRNADEDVAASSANATNSNAESNQSTTEAESSTQDDLQASRSSPSRSSSEPLSGQSRRVLRAQRRARQRRNRNRSPSNQPPEGADATNSDRSTSSPPPESASAANSDNSSSSNARNAESGNNARNAQFSRKNHEMLQRFGIDPEEEDEEEEEVDLEAVRQENQRLKNAKLCQVCKDRDANRLFLPCAHLASCSLCSPALTKCPQCRSNIRGIVSVYFG